MPYTECGIVPDYWYEKIRNMNFEGPPKTILKIVLGISYACDIWQSDSLP